jgi:poly-gamma-glutamate synthesis protein (capsule biosynthesis protein)
MDFHFLGPSRRSHLTPSAGIVFGIVFGIVLSVGAYFFMYQPSGPSWSLAVFRPTHVQESTSITSMADETFVEETFQSADVIPNVSKKTRIILIPHHLVAAREIASMFFSVAKPKRIVLLAPDHLGVGATNVTIGNEALNLNGRMISSDEGDSARLLRRISDARANETAISEELSIQALMPLISYAFPDARVTPILMRIGRDQTYRESLASELIDMLKDDPNLLLISTVDFSHYQPAFVADFHDELAEDVIRGLADLEADRVELDSAGVLAVTLKTARNLGLGEVSIFAHTNSLRILESTMSQDSTSHFVASFSPGDIRSQQALTMLMFGDMMFDREVKNRMSRSGDALFPFTGLMGTEERFVKGQDIIMGNLEGPMTSSYGAPVKENDFAFDDRVGDLLKRVGFSIVSQANNHTLDQGRNGAIESRNALEERGIMWVGDQVNDDASVSLRHISMRGQSVAILAFDTTGSPLDRDEASLVFAQAATATYRVVFMHWGNEYQAKPTEGQIELAHWLIDQGADAIIGSHPHWMESVEVYRGKPIAYSLGNAIFDQDWSSETRFGLLAGLVLRPRGSELHLFPISVIKSVPKLLTGDARQSRLDVLANISDPSLAEQIKRGVLIIEDRAFDGGERQIE